MKGRLWWSSVLPLTATFCLGLATNVASAAVEVGGQSASRQRPGLIDPTCGLVGGPALGSSACDSQTGREWEGIASTDYFSYEPNVYSPPNPDIAVGPDDIVTVVNRTIARYPNPNAPTTANPTGRSPITYTPANTYFYPPTSRQFLDVWLGEGALNELCPTFPRSFASCQIDNASVRYDQMQGRFLVLFTVVDTGLVNCSGCLGVPTQQTTPLRRKASWVLIASRWATGCQGAVGTAGGTGVNIGTTCTPNTNPAAPPLTGNTEFFTTPQPPGPSQGQANSGGLNTNWVSYYGIPDGTCEDACPYGNINSISDIRRGVAAPQGARTIDCNNTAVSDSTRVCYFPSSARLGLDNDNITISSAVYNDNLPLAGRGVAAGTWAWEGTRTRVHKKAGIYTGLTSVATTPCSASANKQCPGASQAATQLQGDFYDLWGNSPAPYTHDRLVTQSVPGGASRDVPGLNYEPVHVRGRSLSSANGNGNQASVTYLLGAVDQPYLRTVPAPTATADPQSALYIRAITFTRADPGPLPTNTGNTTPTVAIPSIIGGIPTLGTLSTTPVPQFANPNSVVQRAKLTQIVGGNNVLTTPNLYVGDDRPHRAIFREGHIYDARLVAVTNYANFSSAAVTSTVTYDIIQKTAAANAPLTIYNTNWGNGDFFSPMFDTPANVIQYGSVSPINIQPFLEKLFVGTTYPPLAPTDARTAAYGYTGISASALQACTGLEPSTTTNNRAYPGLFDIRCGEDAYDTAQAYRHPVSGAFTPDDFAVSYASGFPNQIVPYGIRGGAATDPNNMGLWLYGAYAKGRLASVPGFGQWGTYVAHYPLTFPIRDPYNNMLQGYSDVPAGHPFYTYIQIAKQTEIDPGSRSAAGAFDVNGLVTRQDMARWTIRGQMDEGAITAYLNATGGTYCSFADVQCPGSSGTVTDTTGGQTAGNWRYIETMYRRGYTKGCDTTNDGQRRFCPARNLTRGEMAVFVIRAKMNSVFPTVTSGAFTTSSCSPTLGSPSQPTLVTQVGDQFGLFVGCNGYFTDVPNTHPYYAFIQKLRELRITNGRTLPAAGATQGTYDPDGTLTRGELMTFLVRAFFP